MVLSLSNFTGAAHSASEYIHNSSLDLSPPAKMSTSPSPEEREQKDKADRAREAEEQAKLPYKWTQTIQDVDITIPVAGNLKGRDIIVDMKKMALKVAIKGQDPIIDVRCPVTIPL